MANIAQHSESQHGLSQEQRILMLLEASWPAWVPAPVLARISLQYSARVFSLRRQGWLIENRVEIVNGVKHGSFRLGGSAPSTAQAQLKQGLSTATQQGADVRPTVTHDVTAQSQKRAGNVDVTPAPLSETFQKTSETGKADVRPKNGTLFELAPDALNL